MDSRNISLVKPSLNTKFHVDFNWWKSHDRDWKIYLRGFLCPLHQEMFKDFSDQDQIDWVDPETAEVSQIDAIQNTLINHCAKDPEFLEATSALVDSVFRIFLVNGNKPLNCTELSEIINKPAEIILKTFSTPRVYKGIRPFLTQ